MKRFLKIPIITGSLLFAMAQPSFAQSGSTGTGKETNKGTAKGTSVGNNSDISGGTTNTGSKNADPKTVKNSRHCASNEEFVKQGDRMVCVPRATDDQGQSASPDQNINAPDKADGLNR